MTDMLATAGGYGRGDYPAHTYSYLLCDLRTDTLLAELPLQGVQYSTELNGIGTLRATVPYNSDTLPLDPEAATTPGRTALYVDRDGMIVWAGIVWTRDNVAGGKSIQAAEFMSYYQRRHVKTTLSTDTSAILDTDYVPDGQRLYSDQRPIVWSLLQYAHTQPGGDIGVTIEYLGPGTGISRNVTYYGYERPEIYKAIADLAAADDGFDFGIETGWTEAGANDPPRRYRRARVWYPRRGRASSAESGLVFVKGAASSIIEYDWPEAGIDRATEVSALGEGSGEARLRSTATATDMIAAGWPLLESVQTYEGVIEQSRLDANARAALAAQSQADVQAKFVVLADGDPAFGSYQVGDVALFIIDPEPRTPAGRQAELRIVGMEVTASAGPERVSLTCVAV
ncbi:hypothetical protein AB0F42_24495 [Streptomyces buecherae]|uniref:hypothetical protein n=1 Tax=Streptomyces buecherae TaxID=2763006 RepID=UPI0033FFCFD7